MVGELPKSEQLLKLPDPLGSRFPRPESCVSLLELLSMIIALELCILPALGHGWISQVTLSARVYG